MFLQFPGIGIYIVMFVEVFGTFLKIGLILVLFIVAFGLTFNMVMAQVSILGPILFVLFINDMPQGIDPCTNLALYADDTKIWRKIVTSRDIALLQKDIDYLHKWSINNKMNFHPKNVKFYQ